MNIEEMTLETVKFELKRARFWVEDSPIVESLALIDRMENRKNKIIKDKLC